MGTDAKSNILIQNRTLKEKETNKQSTFILKSRILILNLIQKLRILIKLRRKMKMELLIILLAATATAQAQNSNEKRNKRIKRQSKTKEFNMNFGLSTALKERMHPDLLQKSLSGNCITKEFFTLVIAPVMNEIERRITRLEKIDNKIETKFEEKNNKLNMALMAISVLGPATLILLLVIIIYVERKQGSLRGKVREILAVNNE